MSPRQPNTRRINTESLAPHAVAQSQPTVIIRRPRPDDLIDLAVNRFREGKFENVELLADELGISRATAYKWVGNGEHLLATVLSINAVQMVKRAAGETARRGVDKICHVMMSISRQTLAMLPFRELIERNPEKTLRLVASKSGPVQRIAITAIEDVLREEISDGYLQLPLDSHTAAYILVRLCESFLYADIIIGEAVDLSKLEAATRALMGAQDGLATRKVKRRTRSKA